MSLWQAYRNLNPKTRIFLGTGLVCWGLAGPYVSDKIGDMFGFKPTEADKEALEKIKPKIQVIERST
ncbi:hypothetical protein QBC39DRAFT_384364 [Podospora conica]|nr:hypothetical protein QBC39DRAFT_384364 [Schizothecium conicum]